MSFQDELEKLIMDNAILGVDSGQAYFVDLDQAVTSIINLVDKEREKQLDKTMEIMKATFAENFHYRLMCGEIKDPEGKIDVHKAFIDYQELEPERIKFTKYLEKQRAIIRGGDE